MKSLLVVLFLFVYTLSFAQSPIGIWKTIDDDTKKPKSHIEIYEKDGKIFGKVIKLLDAAKKSICDLCPGEYKDQPILGIDVMKNLVKDGDEWNGGTIMDPNNGKVYKVFIELESDTKLKVRGYIGFALLGRTQYWYRLEE